MRETFKQSETHRIVRFYDERFASSADNVVSAYSTMADGLDALGLTNIGMSESILKKAAGTDKLPDKQEAEVSARAFAAFIDVWADVSSAHTFAVVLSIWNSSARYGETSKRPLCRGRVL